MEYSPDIYKINTNNSDRYALGVTGDNPLLVLGLNPSSADDSTPNPTVKRIMGIAARAGNDGFILINLYPHRSTYPTGIHRNLNLKKHRQNIHEIDSLLSDLNLPEVDILLGFGNHIDSRKFMSRCFKDIVNVLNKYNPNWYKTGAITKAGHPRHPLYVSYSEGLSVFDVEQYMECIL